MDEGKVQRFSEEKKTKNIKQGEKEEKIKEAGAEKIEEKERKVTESNTIDTIVTYFGAAKPETGPEADALKSAMIDCGFIRHTSLHDLEDECELDTATTPTEEVTLAVNNPPRGTHSPRGQSNSAHDVVSKRTIENAVRIVGNMRAS